MRIGGPNTYRLTFRVHSKKTAAKLRRNVRSAACLIGRSFVHGPLEQSLQEKLLGGIRAEWSGDRVRSETAAFWRIRGARTCAMSSTQRSNFVRGSARLRRQSSRN